MMSAVSKMKATLITSLFLSWEKPGDNEEEKACERAGDAVVNYECNMFTTMFLLSQKSHCPSPQSVKRFNSSSVSNKVRFTIVFQP